MRTGLAVLVSIAVAAATTPLAIRIATRLGIVDRPGPTKVHEHPVPYLGGTAVLAGLALPVALARPAVLLPASLALCLGLADDARGLTPGLRLAAEIGIGATAASLFPTSLPEPFGFVAVVAAVVVLVNAVNVIDGLDGLAGSVVAIAAVGFAILLDGPERIAAAALAGALVGFLVFNRPPARIYLGDAGSYLLGCLLAVALASCWASGRSTATGVASLLLVVVPVADLGVSVIRRWVGRKPMLVSDRGHIYDQLVSRTWRPGSATLALAGAQALLVAAAVVAAALDPMAAAVVVAGSLLAVGITIASFGFLTFDRGGNSS